jgi:ribosomal protein S18 acetylase RimI-like enzyme
MKNTEDNKLDNPVWHSLSETHNQLAIDYNNIKFYNPDYCPFGGFARGENILDPIKNYSSLADSFFIVGEEPKLPDGLVIKKNLVCLQMITNERITIREKDTIIKLTDQHSQDLFELVNLVQPGYFRKNTFLLGEYFGIFKDDQLIAVTGERMKMDAITEVSAVVTHPDHTGKGYAKQLVAHTVNNILRQKKIACLHVTESNIGAIKLYEQLGFKLRRKISFWHVGRQNNDHNFFPGKQKK